MFVSALILNFRVINSAGDILYMLPACIKVRRRRRFVKVFDSDFVSRRLSVGSVLSVKFLPGHVPHASVESLNDKLFYA